MMRCVSLLLAFSSLSHACLPGLGLGYNPYNPLGGLGLGGLGGLGYPYGGYGRVGPFRSQANHDQIRNPSVLNCATLDESCRWSNTNEEEMDWVSGKNLPDVQRWHSTLASSNVPDMGAGALISAQRRGWEGGQLVSDTLPCVSPGLRLTATGWKSRIGQLETQPKLQVCSRNVKEARFPLINCIEMEVRNGMPVTVPVPTPNDAAAPAQIILYGNNFAAPEGGAIFVQDIQVDGILDCTTARAADQHPTLVDPLPMPSFGGSIADDRPVAAPQPASIPKYSTLERNSIEAIDAPSASFKSLSSSPVVPSPLISNDLSPSSSDTPSGLFDTCLAISCDATDYLNCNFWRSSGGNQWEIASAKRVSSPKTSITSSPGGAERFLVAPFTDEKEKQFMLVSETVSIPSNTEVYFCFYEYFSSRSFALSICTDDNECFYKKNGVESLEELPEWKVRCTKMPPGNYELRVHAENFGTEKGELGFLPVRLSKDNLASNLIC
ncbi:hypothetical protein PFISCL1PPCAC_27368 [Pristionchus fissidentatus]|uniref:MAM domain-containing protein n=1 Tax=Pristionchus fissidentatus TaxID=1538716 RepID=A0AAV5WVK0_9BILA|nr:hypothetical protein PFISCL1PPCAC_27368 [Pristionchus fissidentatus]